MSDMDDWNDVAAPESDGADAAEVAAPATAAVPAASPATPPAGPDSEDEEELHVKSESPVPAEPTAVVTTDDGKPSAVFEGDETKAAATAGEDADEGVTDTVEESSAKAVPPAAAVPAAGAGSGAGAGSVKPAAGSTCPCMCGPGVEYVTDMLRFKHKIPAFAVLGSTILGYALHVFFGMSHLSIAAAVGLLVVLLGGAIKLHNRYMDPPIPALVVPVGEDCVATVATHVKDTLNGLVAHVNKAVSWECPLKSASALAHLWLLYRFNGLLTSPTFIMLTVVSAFALPTAFDVLRPQLAPIYTASVKPVLSQVLMQVHNVVIQVHALDKTKRYMAAGGAAVATLLTWYMFSSFISLCCILSCAATTSSFALIAMEHRKCIATCCSGAGACPAVSFGQKKKSD